MQPLAQSILQGMPSLLNSEFSNRFSEKWPSFRNLPLLDNPQKLEITNNEFSSNIPTLRIQDFDDKYLVFSKRKRNKKSKIITGCPHTDRKHYAKSMCTNCYHSKARPGKATLCNHNENAMYAKGLCLKCYHRNYKRSRKQTNKEGEASNAINS